MASCIYITSFLHLQLQSGSLAFAHRHFTFALYILSISGSVTFASAPTRMNLLTIVSLIAAASATPVTIPISGDALVATRQLVLDRTSLTENEFSSRFGGGCKDVIFVWARGSTELGNMVNPHQCDLLGNRADSNH